MQFFHNSNIVKNKKSILNIGNVNKPILRAEHKFQIFVKTLAGKTITLDVMTDYNIELVKALILFTTPKKERIPIAEQYLTFQSKILIYNYKPSNYRIQKDDTIWLNYGLRGGGKRGHVIKTVVKSKTADKTLPSDSNLFASVFTHREAINRTTSVSFQSMLKTMPISDLKSLYEYLVHDRSKKDMKIRKVSDWRREIKELDAVQKKIHTAIDLMNTLITDNIQETFVGSEGEFSMKELIRAVDNRIAVVSDEAMTDI